MILQVDSQQVDSMYISIYSYNILNFLILIKAKKKKEWPKVLRDGRSINIWLDRWTPEVLAGGPGPNGASKVVEFVDQDRGWWNEAIIEWTFDVGSVAIVK